MLNKTVHIEYEYIQILVIDAHYQTKQRGWCGHLGDLNCDIFDQDHVVNSSCQASQRG